MRLRFRIVLLGLIAVMLGGCNIAASTETVVGTTHAWLTALTPEGLRRHALPTGLHAGRDPAWCGLPEILSPPDRTKAVRVFFVCNPSGGPDLSQMIVAARTVDVPAGEDPMRVALAALFAGPTEAEQALGLGSFYGPETADFAFDVTVVEGNLA
ncbi:MAG: hypothetical protein HC822_18575, partial [Oscillochloris sp.]|nr:hypothetical protein [Oscillochloris sp.]